jgi:hypothetical protein
VVAGEPGAAETRALEDEVRRRYLPSAVLVRVNDANRPALARLLPWTGALAARDGNATAYVCRDFVCRTPAQSVEALAAQLDEIARRT